MLEALHQQAESIQRGESLWTDDLVKSRERAQSKARLEERGRGFEILLALDIDRRMQFWSC
jgi:hypothetical protein